jgi:hypothetical protein
MILELSGPFNGFDSPPKETGGMSDKTTATIRISYFCNDLTDLSGTGK